MKTAIVSIAIISVIFIIGLCNADDGTQLVEATTAVVAETTSSQTIDLTMRQVCNQYFCRVVIRKNGKWRFRGNCRRMPTRKLKMTCNTCRANFCQDPTVK